MATPAGSKSFDKIVTVTLNPAVDRLIEVPNLTLGAHQRGRELLRIPAGKGVNVSRALAALNVPSIATGFVGQGDLADFEASLPTPLLQPQFLAVQGRTRENVTLVDPVNHVETHIRDVGPQITPDDVDRMAKKLNLLAGPDRLVIFSGSLPPGLGPQRLAEMVEVCRAASAAIALDLPGEVLAAIPPAGLWAIKPNVQELGDMLGQPIESDEQLVSAGRKLSADIRAVMVSQADAGGYLFVAGSALMGQADLDPARVVNTVGCGDALLAGFVAGQMRGDEIRASYRFALAVASAAATSPVPGSFTLDQVEELLTRASVEPIQN